MNIRVLTLMFLCVITIFLGYVGTTQIFGQLTDDKLEFVTVLEQAEGHIQGALENQKTQKYKLTEMHLDYPVETQYDLIKGHLDENDPASRKLELALFILKNTNPEMETRDFKGALSQISKIIQVSKHSIAGEKTVNSPTVKLMIASKLLEESKVAYTEGVQGSEIFKIQGGQQYLERANSLFTDVKDEFDEDKREKISDKFSELFLAYENRVSTTDVELLTDNLIGMIKENVGKNDTSISQQTNDTSSKKQVSNSVVAVQSESQTIPDWVKTAMKFWIQGLISDQEIANMLTFAVSNGIIQGSADSDDVSMNKIKNFQYGLPSEIKRVEELATNPKVKKFLAKSNEEFANTPKLDAVIQQRNSDWQDTDNDKISPFMLALQNNELGQLFKDKLKEPQNNLLVLDEIEATNAYGVTVAHTYRTTDYIQSDEAWWVIAAKDGMHVDYVEYDRRSASYDTSISIRVDDKNGNLLGIIKAEIAISSFLT